MNQSEKGAGRRWTKVSRSSTLLIALIGTGFAIALLSAWPFASRVGALLRLSRCDSAMVHDASSERTYGPSIWIERRAADSLKWLQVGSLGPWDQIVEIQMPDLHPGPKKPLPFDAHSMRVFRHEIRSLNFNERLITDRDVVLISSMHQLSSLSLRGADIPSDGIKRIVASCSRIERLDLSSATGLSPGSLDFSSKNRIRAFSPPNVEGMETSWIERLPKLQSLDLSSTEIDDEGLESIVSRCPVGLSNLDLSGTRVTDEGLLQLARCPSLAVLILQNVDVGDPGVAVCSVLPSLIRLDILSSRVTDVSLRALAKAPSLERLAVTSDSVTELGVEQLGASQSLKNVRISSKHVDEIAVERLRRARPDRLVNGRSSD